MCSLYCSQSAWRGHAPRPCGRPISTMPRRPGVAKRDGVAALAPINEERRCGVHAEAVSLLPFPGFGPPLGHRRPTGLGEPITFGVPLSIATCLEEAVDATHSELGAGNHPPPAGNAAVNHVDSKAALSGFWIMPQSPSDNEGQGKLQGDCELVMETLALAPGMNFYELCEALPMGAVQAEKAVRVLRLWGDVLERRDGSLFRVEEPPFACSSHEYGPRGAQSPDSNWMQGQSVVGGEWAMQQQSSYPRLHPGRQRGKG